MLKPKIINAVHIIFASRLTLGIAQTQVIKATGMSTTKATTRKKRIFPPQSLTVSHHLLEFLTFLSSSRIVVHLAMLEVVDELVSSFYTAVKCIPEFFYCA